MARSPIKRTSTPPKQRPGMPPIKSRTPIDGDGKLALQLAMEHADEALDNAVKAGQARHRTIVTNAAMRYLEGNGLSPETHTVEITAVGPFLLEFETPPEEPTEPTEPKKPEGDSKVSPEAKPKKTAKKRTKR